MEPWQAVASMSYFSDYKIIKAPLPEHDPDKYSMSMKCCEENICGHYGTNWGCSPCTKIDPEKFYKGYDYVLVVNRTFEIDWRENKEIMSPIMKDVDHTFRVLLSELKNNGLVCKGFLDGPCKYCGECSYPDPCRFPEMMVPSVSILGIDLVSYLEKIGLKFEFVDGIVNIYGLIFVE